MKQPQGQFPGGLKLAGHKAESTTQAIQAAPISAQLVLPLQQHIGHASLPIVAVGDVVLKGQCIATADDYISVPLHAPTSGTITAIDDQAVPHPSGLSAPCITITTDGKEEWCALNPVADFKSLSEHELRQRVRDAGIVGLGGAGFPTFIKLNPHANHQVKTLIINCAECEPYITCDDMLIRERAAKILDGIAIMRHAIGVPQCIIAIEDNKPAAITAFTAALAARDDLGDTDLMVVPTRYPAGGEKQLIQTVTGKMVPSGGLPIDIGIACQNVGTTYAIARAIMYGEPLISRVVTITGSNIAQPANFDTLIGTPISDLLAHCGYQADSKSPVILGGPMMGFELLHTDLPLAKTSNCVLAGMHDASETATPLPCIRCGDCAVACPASLLPQQLYWHARSDNLDKTREYNLFDCIECGCCSYVCPSEIPLVQYFRYAKTATMNHDADLRQSDIARERHETRQARQEREKADKAERQRQRKAALAASKAAKEEKS